MAHVIARLGIYARTLADLVGPATSPSIERALLRSMARHDAGVSVELPEIDFVPETGR